MKLVDYIGSNISLTISDVKIRIDKALTAIDRLPITLKSIHSDRIKCEIF